MRFFYGSGKEVHGRHGHPFSRSFSLKGKREAELSGELSPLEQTSY
jgi:hypothetical protein